MADAFDSLKIKPAATPAPAPVAEAGLGLAPDQGLEAAPGQGAARGPGPEGVIDPGPGKDQGTDLAPVTNLEVSASPRRRAGPIHP